MGIIFTGTNKHTGIILTNVELLSCFEKRRAAIFNVVMMHSNGEWNVSCVALINAEASTLLRVHARTYTCGKALKCHTIASLLPHPASRTDARRSSTR